MLNLSNNETSPALKSHFEAQFSFLSDLSKNMFDATQQLGQINVQILQAVMEEAINTTHQLMEANTSTEYLSITTSQMQPVVEKICSYQQHVNNIAARIQVEASRTAEQHVPETTRTAAAVAEEVVQRAEEETDKVTQRQKAVFDQLKKPTNESQTEQQESSMHSSQQQPVNKQTSGRPA